MTKKEDLKLTAPYFLAIIVITLLMLVAQKSQLNVIDIFKVNYTGVPGIINPFTYNDSQWYLHLAEYGYENNHALFAFFPLYPLLIRFLHLFGIPYAWGGMLISWSCFFSAGYLICRLLPEKEKIIGLAIFFLSPIAIFNLSVYTESLFLFLCLLVWYLYKNEKYIPAGAALGLAMLTRNSAYFVTFFLFIEFITKTVLSSGERNWSNGIALFIPAGIIGAAYPLYTLITQGDLFLFLNVQSQYWSRIRMNPLVTIATDINKLFVGQISIYSFSILFNLVSVALVILLVVKLWKKEPILLSILCFITLAALSAAVDTPFMPSSMSLFRYIWGTFPIYLLLPNIMHGLSKWTNLLLSAVYLFILLLNIIAAFLKALLA